MAGEGTRMGAGAEEGRMVAWVWEVGSDGGIDVPEGAVTAASAGCSLPASSTAGSTSVSR